MSWKRSAKWGSGHPARGWINRHCEGSHSKRHHWGTSICTRGRKRSKSLQLLPGSSPYKNIQDAFQATKGNSVNSFIFFFSTITIFWKEKKKLIIEMDQCIWLLSFSYTYFLTHLTFLKPWTLNKSKFELKWASHEWRKLVRLDRRASERTICEGWISLNNKANSVPTESKISSHYGSHLSHHLFFSTPALFSLILYMSRGLPHSNSSVLKS